MDILKPYVAAFAVVIIVVYLLSLLARWHWFFAILSHFTLQYCTGALVILPFLMFLNHNAFLSVCIIVIGFSTYIQVRLPMSNPWALSPPAKESTETFRVAQYNKYYGNRPYEQLKTWVENKNIDLLVMQEVRYEDMPHLDKSLLPLLPYTLPKGSQRPDFIIIFSKYKIQNLHIKQICELHCKTHAVRFEITMPNDQIFTVYSVHTNAPLGARKYKAHHEELLRISEWIATDKRENVIFMGDWNTTPYSPIFKTVLNVSGLQYQNYRVLPESTWPSFTLLPFLKIPIDHILFSDNLRLESINKDSALGSDHHSLIATFAIE